MGIIEITKPAVVVGQDHAWVQAGAPTNDSTLLGQAVVGSLYSDSTTGKMYTCVATNGSTTITWQLVGSQS